MPRFLSTLGYALGIFGTAGGAWLLASRYASYTESISQARVGPAFFAPLLWQLSLTTGLTIVVLSLLFGLLLVALGRTMARVERLERALLAAAPAAPAAPLAVPAEHAVA